MLFTAGDIAGHLGGKVLVPTRNFVTKLTAARLAAGEMVDLLQARLGLCFEDAYMLMSAAVDVQICQCCEPGEFPVTTRAVISKGILP